MSVQDLSDDELMFLLGQAPAAQTTRQPARLDVRSMVVDTANRYGVPPELALAVTKQESAFRTDAVSPKGASGLMQLMPATARELGVDPTDPAQNVDGGVRYLKQQLDRFGDPRLALAAYNAGPGAVEKYGDVPPYAETQDYVDRILGDGPAPAAPAQDLSKMSDQELRALLADVYPEKFGAGQAAPLDFATGLTDKEYLDVLEREGIYTPQQGERMVRANGRMLPIGLARMLGGYEEDGPEGLELVMAGGADGGQLDRDLLQLRIDSALEKEANWRKGLLEQGREHYDSFSPTFKAVSALTGGAADTLTMGTFDEMAGGLGSLVNDLTPAENAALVRQMRSADYEDRPAMAIGGQLAGGLLLPGGKFLGGAKSLPGAMSRGAALGAGYGTAYGAGSADGDLGDRAQGAVTGGLTGAAFGAGLPVAGRVISDAARPAVQSAAALSERVGLRTGIPNRMSPTNRRVAEVLDRNLGRDGATLESVLAAQADNALPFERAGENLVGLAEVMAQAPGRARSLAREALTGRTAAAGDRTQEAIGGALGGKGDYLASLEASIAARREEAQRGIAEVGGQLVTLDPNSVRALRSEMARPAIAAQARRLLSSLDDQEYADGIRLKQLADDLLERPGAQTITVRDAQNISKALLDGADEAFRNGGGDGPQLKALGRAIRDNAGNPDKGGFAEYGAWLKRYGDDSDNIAALEAGRDIFSPRMERSAEALRKQFVELSDVGKDNFRKGVGEALIAQVRSRKGGVGAMRDLLRSQEFADRVRTAFPDGESFDGFMAFAKREVDMQERANQVLGNSATARRQMAAQDVEEPMTATDFILDNATLDAAAFAGRATKSALKKVPRKDRGVLTNPKLNETMGEALFGDGDILERLLRDLETERALRRLVRSRGQATGGRLAPGGTAAVTDRTGAGQRTN